MAGALPIAAGITSAASLAGSGGTSAGGSQNTSYNTSQSYSNSDAAAAREFSAEQARLAYERSKELWQMQANFNSAEAAKARDWEAQMANTTYQRTIKDMITAGVNPILAANAGLSGDTVTSAASATAGMPQNFMANTVAGSQSASASYGESEGSSWSQSISGLAYLADAISGAIKNMQSASQINIAIDGLEQVLNHDWTQEDVKETGKAMGEAYFNKDTLKDAALAMNLFTAPLGIYKLNKDFFSKLGSKKEK